MSGTIYSLTITQQGLVYDTRYFYSRKAAEKERDADKHRYLMRYLITANRIKDMDRLAHGIVAQRRTYNIAKHRIYGGLEEESQ